MKTTFKSFLFILVLSIAVYSQGDKRGDPKEKIEALEKIKLLETLDLDEETALKFFARRNEHMSNMKKLFDENDLQFGKIENKLSSIKDENDPELKKLVDNYLAAHLRIEEEKKRFFNSLSDILSNKQLAQLAIFERRFKEEIRDVLFRHKKRKWD